MNEVQLKKLLLAQNVNSGANWFYWIAVLTAVNSIANLSGTSLNFVIGLSICQGLDAAALVAAKKVASAIPLAIGVEYVLAATS